MGVMRVLLLLMGYYGGKFITSRSLILSVFVI